MGKGSGPNESAGTNIDAGKGFSPTNIATFTFYIIFTIFTAIQTWFMYRRCITHNDNVKKSQCGLTLLGTFLLLLYYILGAVYVAKDLRKSVQSEGEGESEFDSTTLTNAFYATFAFCERVADVVITFTLFSLLDHRGVTNGERILWTPKLRNLSRLIAYPLFSCIAVFASLSSIFRGTWYKMHNPGAAIKGIIVLHDFYVAFYMLVIIFLGFLSGTMWMRMAQNKVVDPIIRYMTISVIPLLYIRGLAKISVDIVESVALSPSINYEVVVLFEVLISGFTYLGVLSSVYGMGAILPPISPENPAEAVTIPPPEKPEAPIEMPIPTPTPMMPTQLMPTPMMAQMRAVPRKAVNRPVPTRRPLTMPRPLHVDLDAPLPPLPMNHWEGSWADLPRTSVARTGTGSNFYDQS